MGNNSPWRSDSDGKHFIPRGRTSHTMNNARANAVRRKTSKMIDSDKPRPYTLAEKIGKHWDGMEPSSREEDLHDVCKIDYEDRATMEKLAGLSWEKLPENIRNKMLKSKDVQEHVKLDFDDKYLEEMIHNYKEYYGSEHDKALAGAMVNSAGVPLTTEWITYPGKDRKRFLSEIGVKNPKDVSTDYLWKNLSVEQMKDLAVRIFG